MKPPLFVPIHRGVIPFASGLRRRFATFLMVAAATGLGAGVAFSQQPQPGAYYQQNPPGSAVNGVTYNELAYVNSLLVQPNTSIFDPLPPGDTAASIGSVDTALATAVQNVINGTVPGGYPGITLASLATQMVANQPANQAAVVSQIASELSVFSEQHWALASLDDPLTAATNGVITALATTYPTTFSTISQSIFTSAAANAGTAALNSGALSQMALAATAALSTDDKSVGAIVGQALTAAASSSALTTAQKQTAMTGVVSAQLSSTAINSSPASIAAIATSMTTSSVAATVPLATMLNAAVAALPAADKAATPLGNVSVGAIAVGALVSNAPNAATIMSTLASGNANTQAYTNMIVNGFNNSSTVAAYQAYVNANPNYADAIVAGATVEGIVTSAVLIADALKAGSAVPVQYVVAAAISADLTKASAGYYTNNPPATTPMDNATTIVNAAVGAFSSPTSTQLQNITLGAVGAARVTDAGPITFAVISDSPGYTPPGGANGTLSTANVSSVVNGAVTAAYTTRQTAVADAVVANIVYNAEKASYNTSATLTTAVQQAITTMQALNTAESSDLPTYIAAAAALAGYAGTSPSTALPMIQSAAESTPGYTPTTTATNAINAAEAIVNAIRPSSGGTSGTFGVNTTTAFPNTMSAFSANASAPDSVQAVLYAASLADPNDSSAFLAAAIGKTPVASSTLLADAINVSQVVTNANESGNSVTGLTLVSAVASHIAANLVSQNDSDLSNFVGYQAAQNTAYVKDIATAAVTVDPYQSNYVARAVAYNSPTTAYQAISSIFNYSQITTMQANPGRYSPSGGYIDSTAAAAAISAGYTTGIVETAASPTMTNTTVQTALTNGIAASVTSALSVLGTPLRGAPIAQSNGMSTTSNTTTASVGAAGVITGFVSQVVTKADTTSLGSNNTTLNNGSGSVTSTSIIDAVLAAAVKVPGASTYTMQMAQAAGQAYGYITAIIGGQSSATWAANDFSIATEIAKDMTGATSGTLFNYAYNAAYFGATQGQAGVPGAGATGVSADYVNGTSATYYNQNGGTSGNPTGNPVTNIFNL